MLIFGEHPGPCTARLTLGFPAHLIATSVNGWAGPVVLEWGGPDPETPAAFSDVGTVDGDTVTTVTPSGAASVGEWTSAALTLTTHTVRVTGSAGTAAQVVAVEAYNGFAGSEGIANGGGLFADGVHPSQRGHELYADAIFDVIGAT